MFHAELQDQQRSGSDEDFFSRFAHHVYGHGGHLGHVTGII